MDKIEKNFHKSLEQDIDHLKEEIGRVQESEENRSFESKEVVKKSFENISQKDSGVKEKPDIPSTQKTSQSDDEFLPEYMQGDDIDPKAKIKVEELMDLVIHKGILKALRASKKQPPFIQDAFHDALADKLVPELKKRGILK